MKRNLLAAAILCAWAAHADAGLMFKATLTGDQEVPTPVVTSATGTATLILNDAQTELSYDVRVKGLDFGGFFTTATDDNLTGIHIHDGDFGDLGSVVFGLLSPAHDFNMLSITLPSSSEVRFTGTWDAADVANGAATLASQLTDLIAGGLYFNVHTSGNPGGEVRGQIYLVPEPSALLLSLLGIAGLGLRVPR